MMLSTPCCIHLTVNCTSVLMTGYAGWMRPAMISISSAFPPPGAKKNFFANTMLEDEERKCLWIGTEGELICLHYGRAESIPLFQDNSVKSLVFDVDKNLLIGTDNGLYIYNPTTGKHSHLFHDSRNSHSLSNNIVWSIFSDKDANIWLVRTMAYPLPAILILIYSYPYGN